MNLNRLVFLTILSSCVSFGARAEGIFNVRDYGATGAGTTLDHTAINALEKQLGHKIWNEGKETVMKDQGAGLFVFPIRLRRK